MLSDLGKSRSMFTDRMNRSCMRNKSEIELSGINTLVAEDLHQTRGAAGRLPVNSTDLWDIGILGTPWPLSQAKSVGNLFTQ